MKTMNRNLQDLGYGKLYIVTKNELEFEEMGNCKYDEESKVYYINGSSYPAEIVKTFKAKGVR